MSENNFGYKRLDRTLIHHGAIIDVYQDTMQIPNGNTAKWDFIGHKGAAAVVAVRDDGKLVMVKQYRNALERVTLEIPAGGRDGAEEPFLECAHRELEEETGYTCKKEDMQFLISVYTTVAFCNERIDIFLAEHLTPSRQHLDEDEYLNVVACDLDELLELIYAGKMQDAKTVAAILAYQNLLQQRGR
ncbi:MAG: NUDIX hydrolase [Lachnospiraceae bacterium]|nr:NUDIX hydrolase [Lachnospiraceae bacterium]